MALLIVVCVVIWENNRGTVKYVADAEIIIGIMLSIENR